MKTSTQKRIARFSGLLLLALLLVALAVPAALAMRTSGTSVPPTFAGSVTIAAQQLPTLAQVQQHQAAAASTSAGSATVNVAQRPTQAQLQRVHGGANGPSVASGGGTVTATQPAPSGVSATTIWISVGAAIAVLIIALVAWALIRRRRQPSAPGSSAYCALHPGDTLCGAG